MTTLAEAAQQLAAAAARLDADADDRAAYGDVKEALKAFTGRLNGDGDYDDLWAKTLKRHPRARRAEPGDLHSRVWVPGQ